MNIRLTTLYLGGLFALTSFVARLALADEWNKKTEFQFSAPVQIPGKTLAAGKYVFQLADSESDRNIVQIFSEDSVGRETLVATLMAVPDCIEQTPYKAIVHFEERPSRGDSQLVLPRREYWMGVSFIHKPKLQKRTERRLAS